MDLTIKIIVADFDGVLTDGGIYYGENGQRLKKLNIYDTMAFSILQKHGIQSAIIAADSSDILTYVTEDLGGIKHYENVKDKQAMAEQICNEFGVKMQEMAFIGDDLNDRGLIENVGLAACPGNAPGEVQNINNILILHRYGGKGAVRELVDYIVENEFYWRILTPVAL